MCNSGGKGTALSYPFRPTALLLKQSNALIKFGILYGNCDVAGESRKQIDVLSVVRIPRQFWCKHENREQLGFMNHRARTFSAHCSEGRDRISCVALMFGLSEESAIPLGEHRYDWMIGVDAGRALFAIIFIISQHDVKRSAVLVTKIGNQKLRPN